MIQGVTNYCLNKFCPIFIIAFLLFLNLGFKTWEPYVIMALVFFTERFSFKTGYAVAYCESNGIKINE
jgi:hypothetical protein